MAAKKKRAASGCKRITIEDLKSGFLTIGAYEDNRYILRRKKSLGVSAGEKLLIRWK